MARLPGAALGGCRPLSSPPTVPTPPQPRPRPGLSPWLRRGCRPLWRVLERGRTEASRGLAGVGSRCGVSLSRGVNMYAMLTGTLPFTVEPFSLRALYQKMVDKEMNPLPTQLSTGNVPAGRGPRLGAGCVWQRGREDHQRLQVSSQNGSESPGRLGSRCRRTTAAPPLRPPLPLGFWPPHSLLCVEPTGPKGLTVPVVEITRHVVRSPVCDLCVRVCAASSSASSLGRRVPFPPGWSLVRWFALCVSEPAPPGCHPGRSLRLSWFSLQSTRRVRVGFRPRKSVPSVVLWGPQFPSVPGPSWS